MNDRCDNNQWINIPNVNSIVHITSVIIVFHESGT